MKVQNKHMSRIGFLQIAVWRKHGKTWHENKYAKIFHTEFPKPPWSPWSPGLPGKPCVYNKKQQTQLDLMCSAQ